mgnify:FL=1
MSWFFLFVIYINNLISKSKYTIMTEKLLAIVVVVLVILIIYREYNASKGTKADDSGSATETFASPDDQISLPTLETKQLSLVTKEQRAVQEQLEHFAVCGANDGIKCENVDMSYGDNEFGAPGMDYNSWVASQAVDDQVIKNHSEFVQDRMYNKVFWTGRVYTPDSHDSYDPLPWTGLRRPVQAPQCNPTQVPDVDISLYDEKQKLRF